MSEVEQLTYKLSRAVMESEEYARYIQSYKALAQYPSLMREANELRKNNFTLQNSDNFEGMFDRVEAFRRKYDELRKHEVVSDFLQAELCLSRMIQMIFNSIAGSIDIDIDFLNDGGHNG